MGLIMLPQFRLARNGLGECHRLRAVSSRTRRESNSLQNVNLSKKQIDRRNSGNAYHEVNSYTTAMQRD